MFRYPSVIIVNGLPAAGKTTIAKKLAEDLKLPLFRKDAIKETLFDHLGYDNRETSRKYGIATYEVIYQLLAEYLHSDLPCIIESNFNPQFDRPKFEKLMKRYNFKVVEVFCQAPYEVIIDRFEKRAQSGERHPGHNDLQSLEEFKNKLQTPMEPLNLDGKVLRVDCSDFEKFNYGQLLHDVKFWMNFSHLDRGYYIGAAFGIIFNDNNEVLLCHRTDKDLWNLPGGGLEIGESPWTGAIREVKEETGLDVELSKLSGIYFKPKTNEKQHDELAFAFPCRIIGGEITLNEEADQIKYFPVNDLPENISPRQIERIRDAFEKNPNTTFKIQQQ